MSEAEQPLNIAVVSLMGLPASGKSTLCNEIVQKTRADGSTTCVILAYDNFVPLKVQALCSSDELSAKNLRRKFLQVIDIILFSVIEGNSFQNFDDEVKAVFKENENSPESPLDFKNWRTTLELETFDRRTCKNVLLLIDDNNYYHSMRNELYQVAKKYKTGFCILYTKASVSECTQRNSARSEELRVANTVIEEMDKRLEEPDPLQNSFDSLAFQINDVTDVNSYNLIQSVLDYALQHPIDAEPIPDRREEIEADRRICSENEIHQADQILRKWIHTEITLASFSKQTKDKKKFSTELLLKKSSVLNGLKSGELSVVALATDPIAFRREIVNLARVQDISFESDN